ncbi:hypothetical protein [Croceimicrobium sp.]|uniref:hypothetical protein n=1 Tax=Croceimicrobium sp. TaxID=2828340 RepID=UPI003BA9B60F
MPGKLKSILWGLSAVLLIAGCRKGEIDRNGLPDTFISYEAINLSGQNRLNSSVRLTWYGTDGDGYISGYELSLDNQNWEYTTTQDSVFLFDIPPGQDSADISFFVRAIDNDDNIDPSPAFLKVPLINTPPDAAFLDDRGPSDTAFIAATFFWQASDPDGDNTLKAVEMKINEGDWVEIDRGQNLITFLADTNVQNGEASAEIYYGQSTAAAPYSINGLKVNDSNRVYIRSIDIADAISDVDTSEVFYFRPKTSGVNMLWVSGHNSSIKNQYKGYLQSNNLNYDLLNFGYAQGANLPKYFDPTVQLIFKQYQQAFLNLPSTNFRNSVTGDEKPLIDYLAPVIQRFTDNGGKYFLTTQLTSTQDLSESRSVYPIDDIVVSTVPGSQARITTDSALVNLVDTTLYPELAPTNVEFGVVPMVASADAQDFYYAQITRFRGWNGSSQVVAAVRRRNSKISQVFFCMELHRFERNAGAIEQLIGEIFDNEF